MFIHRTGSVTFKSRQGKGLATDSPLMPRAPSAPPSCNHTQAYKHIILSAWCMHEGPPCHRHKCNRRRATTAPANARLFGLSWLPDTVQAYAQQPERQTRQRVESAGVASTVCLCNKVPPVSPHLGYCRDIPQQGRAQRRL